MKKIWKLMSLLLIIAMLAGTVAVTLTGCGKGEEVVEEEEFQLEVEGFQVGFSRVIMNPQTSAPLTGFGNEAHRYFTNVMDDITCSAIAVSDAYGNHYIWMTSDLMSISDSITSMTRKFVSQKTGIPENNIINAVTHTHSAPTPTRSDLLNSTEYLPIIIQKQTEAAINALKDRKPAQVYVGSVETERMNFLRHLYHTTLTGERKYFGDNFGVPVFDDTTQMVHEPDATMHMLRFVREGDKDIILSNFRAHSHFTDGLNAYNLSADCWASFREALEDRTGAHVAFFQGAPGNVNANTRLPLLQRTTDMRTYGNYLAEHALDGLENNMRKIEDPRIEYKMLTISHEINHSMNHLYAQAKEISTIWAQTGNKADINHLLTQDGTGIRSPYQASAIVANFTRTTDKHGQMTIRAVSLSEDFAIYALPNELFDELSVYGEENSPFETTMFFGYADEYFGYLPSAAAYEYTCYETDITRYANGSGEKTMEVVLEMLNELYKRYE